MTHCLHLLIARFWWVRRKVLMKPVIANKRSPPSSHSLGEVGVSVASCGWGIARENVGAPSWPLPNFVKRSFDLPKDTLGGLARDAI
jgi:hypothetical protein